MMTLRCTRTLLTRLRVPADADNPSPSESPLGDWYANLIRVGHEQVFVAVSERAFLTVILPAKGLADRLPRDFPRMMRTLLEEIEVPEEVIGRELAAMQPMAYARTRSKSAVASLNERARLVEVFWRDGLSPVDIMRRMAAHCGPAAHGYEAPSRIARGLLGLDPSRPPPTAIARLHVVLEGLQPAIWRRLVVPAGITLPRLHLALQAVMGWENVHLHEFLIGEDRYGVPDDDLDTTPGSEVKAEEGVRLSDLVAQGAVFRYGYDFGDDWWHEVRVEYLGPNDAQVRGATCVGGANQCPPEDVGGPPGYLELLQALRDPAHERHRELVAWRGGRPFDPAQFDTVIANARLRGVLGEG